MSQPMLITLTVSEIVVLVVVLALFLILIAGRLRSVADLLGHVARGASTIEEHVRQVGPGAGRINQTLSEIVGALPSIAQEAEALADNIEKGRSAQPEPVPTTQKTRTRFTYYDG